LKSEKKTKNTYSRTLVKSTGWSWLTIAVLPQTQGQANI